jgi:hypothetical protein
LDRSLESHFYFSGVYIKGIEVFRPEHGSGIVADGLRSLVVGAGKNKERGQ